MSFRSTVYPHTPEEIAEVKSYYDDLAKAKEMMDGLGIHITETTFHGNGSLHGATASIVDMYRAIVKANELILPRSRVNNLINNSLYSNEFGDYVVSVSDLRKIFNKE